MLELLKEKFVLYKKLKYSINTGHVIQQQNKFKP